MGGFQDSQIVRLRDDRANQMPTKANMLQSLSWLVGGAQPGDEMFLHYSGHGGQQRDRTGDERDGKDETLIPCDFQTAGQITDDELWNILVKDLPKGSRLWVIFDCCHIGSALDLKFKVAISPHGRSAKVIKAGSRKMGGQKTAKARGEVIMISGCKDDQTSADMSGGGQKAAGAMTTSFRHVITPEISCEDLLQRMRQYLKRNHFNQVP